jgi:D-tyrosyl-tRNA(Tyr) deacylase
MKALIQRVSMAEVQIETKLYGKIGAGMLVLLGVEKGDTEHDAEYISKKICHLRIFEDIDHKMNLSVTDIQGEILVISQFTLAAQCRKGNRPSFDLAEEPARARELYVKCIDLLKKYGITVKTGDFGASMAVQLINDGPVTILLDSRSRGS